MSSFTLLSSLKLASRSVCTNVHESLKWLQHIWLHSLQKTFHFKMPHFFASLNLYLIAWLSSPVLFYKIFDFHLTTSTRLVPHTAAESFQRLRFDRPQALSLESYGSKIGLCAQLFQHFDVGNISKHPWSVICIFLDNLKDDFYFTIKLLPSIFPSKITIFPAMGIFERYILSHVLRRIPRNILSAPATPNVKHTRQNYWTVCIVRTLFRSKVLFSSYDWTVAS